MSKAKFPKDPNEATLEEAKAWLRKRVDKGAHCPCCNKPVRVFTYKFHTTMARVLLLVYRVAEEMKPEGGWFHIQKELEKRGYDHPQDLVYSKLRYWKLIESETGRTGGGPGKGVWRITERGRQFAEGKILIERTARIYDKKALPSGQAQEQVSIHDALGDRFNYDDMMSGEHPPLRTTT